MVNSEISVIGAGNMGAGIAQKYATYFSKVLLIDNNEESLQKSQKNIQSTLNEAVKKGVFTNNKAKKISAAIELSCDLTKVQNSDLVIEAIFEDFSIKQKLFKELETILSPNAILATNTSSFSLKSFQNELSYPERFLGLHYFYHPAKNRLVEIVGGELTSNMVLKKAKYYQDVIGKVGIFSKDSKGFIVNRFFVPWLNEAAKMVEEGLGSIATVEKIFQEVFKVPMGPFTLMNVTGPKIAYQSCLSLQKDFGDFYAPSPIIKTIVENQQDFCMEGNYDSKHRNEIINRALSVVFSIAFSQIFKEEICSKSDLEIGARVGLLWPQGPLGLFNQYRDSLQSFHSQKKVILPAKTSNEIFQSSRFVGLCVDYYEDEELGVITFKKPSTLNALDEELLSELDLCFHQALASKNTKGILLRGQKNFMAGADLSFFKRNLEKKNFDAIESFTHRAGKLFREIHLSLKPVLAFVDGFALGGGLELALCAKKILATPKAKMGFPETSIGIYPGLGGTQRTAKKLGVAKARFLVLTGTILNAEEAQKMGLVDEVCSYEEHLSKAKEVFMRLEKPHRGGVDNISTDFISKEFSKPLGELLNHSLENTDLEFRKSICSLRKKAPLALSVADDLIFRSKKLMLEEGLHLEQKFLRGIFSSKDALAGITAKLNKKTANFRGK